MSPPINFDVQWPACFKPWPVEVTETDTEKHMYTDEEIFECKRWLKDKNSRNFSKWASVKVDNAKEWFDLELVIKTALKIEPKQWSLYSKNACQDVWGAKEKSKVGKQQRNTLADNKTIGVETATKVLEKSDLQWRDEGLAWGKLAFIALAPRLNSLAKKTSNQKKPGEKKEKASSLGGKSTTSTTVSGITKSAKSESITTTATRRRRLSPVGNMHTSKRQKTEQHPTKNESFNEKTPLLHKSIPQLLCNQNIVVQLDPDIAAEIGASSYVVVGISAIIDDGAQEQHHINIRCNHLSWQKFKQLLLESDPAYHIDGLRRLFWDDLSDIEKGPKKSLEIRDENDFRCAVGMLHWNARTQRRIMMQIRDGKGIAFY
ncbi:hypothetical protein B7494_g1578 [Chlorociboria aeruginascens]|nr:hypothetical protein B7494_g1578 [Chlorociboria aeruginascens]